MRIAGTVVRAMGEIPAHFELVTAPPFLYGEPVNRQEFELVGGPRPGVEEVAAPPFRRNQHLFWPLAVRVAVKSGVSKYRGQQCAGAELVAVGGSEGYASLAFIRRGSLGDQRTDVGKLCPVGKPVHIHGQQVPRG